MIQCKYCPNEIHNGSDLCIECYQMTANILRAQDMIWGRRLMITALVQSTQPEELDWENIVAIDYCSDEQRWFVSTLEELLFAKSYLIERLLEKLRTCHREDIDWDFQIERIFEQ